ncbi:MAG: TldD/PmbA family protein [Elusimicrobiota bacterium]|jgi:TldD protein|nr:TldD/PmbA family protein [Elusimicrobiota bacterium]
MKKLLLASLLLTFLMPAWCKTKPLNENTDPIMKTMEQEVARSMKKLKKANPPVYFLSYQITFNDYFTLSSYLGETGRAVRLSGSLLDTEARVGNRHMDNTRKIKSVDFSQTYTKNRDEIYTPLDGNIKNLKEILWINTEEAVKQAQEEYYRVKINSQTAAARSDNSDDFSAPINPPARAYQSLEPLKIDEAALTKQLNGYSALFKGYPFIYSSSVMLTTETNNIYFANSEGTAIKKAQTLLRLSYVLTSRNKDGMEVTRGNSYDALDMAGLPPSSKVEADIANSIQELKALQNATAAEPFHGPAILKNRAAGVFFHEILGHRVEGHRQKDDDFGQTFTKKLNEQIMSPIISVYDNPNLAAFKNIPLRGHYTYDDEGVRAQDVTIIKDGVLKGFLMSRSPIKNFPQSNGHGRKEPGRTVVARMGVTMVKAKETVPYATLKQLLVEEIKKQGKPYGLVIDDISGGFTNTDTFSPQSFKVQALLVYKVYPDGRPDEIIRGADIVGTPLTSFNKIIAAADDDDVFNGSCGAESGWVPVSAISPSLLISELEIENVGKSYDNLPLLPPPSSNNPKTEPAAAKTTQKGGK